jgi:hypothetical protein
MTEEKSRLFPFYHAGPIWARDALCVVAIGSHWQPKSPLPGRKRDVDQGSVRGAWVE